MLGDWIRTVQTKVLEGAVVDLSKDVALMQAELKQREAGARTYDEITKPLVEAARSGGLLGAADDRHMFASGAMSSGIKPPYHLIPAYALSRIADRFKLGAGKYGENNWKKGAADRDFILDRINHGIEHLINLKEQVMAADRGETVETFDDDDCAAVILNAIFVMEWQVQRGRPAVQDGRATRDIKKGETFEISLQEAVKIIEKGRT